MLPLVSRLPSLVSLGLMLLPAGASVGRAQDSTFVVVDRIVAVVTGRPILLSRVNEQINIMRATGRPVPGDSAGLEQLRRSIVEELVNEELIVQAAQKDTTITLMMQEVQGAVDEATRQIRQQFASDLEFQRQLRTAGFGTLEEYQRWLYEQKRRENLRNQVMQKLRSKGILKPLPPTEAEVRQFFDRNQGQLPRRPATVSFRQIVIRPRPDSAAVAVARQRADSVLRQLRRGADFATLAKRFSEDETTKETGGELGWFRRGQMVKEFDLVAFNLRPGQISDPFRSPFGFHIVQVQRIDPAEVQARHILFVPEVTDANRAAAAALADSVARLLRSGAPLDSLTRLYNDPTEEALADNVPRNQLPQEYQAAFAAAQPGDVVGPFAVQLPTGDEKHVVLQFQVARPEGEMGFEELRDQIRSRLAEENAMRRYLQGLRKQTYVDIRL
ncbi:MAG: peptidylprolyl isomerase [Gemmatimonadetes bacterium]|nr:peptidylprolyl isomerase [Gemmatimonadota bacterium]